MSTSPLTPRKALNKALLKVKPKRTEIELFKTNLISLLDSMDDRESEEFHKNLVADFLRDTYYKNRHFINTKGRNDQVIHNGTQASSSVGVIIEAKKPGNRSEMVSADRLNTKAFHELVLYYLRERITHKNLEVKHLVATNINEWFIFDAVTFDRLFAQNKALVEMFIDFEGGRLSDTKTDFFYKQIAEPFIAGITAEIEFTYFNLQEYQKPLRNEDKEDDTKLIALYKILSPEHLLKQPLANDGNSLNRHFYSELLHIIGLTEIKDGGKKLIQRNKDGERNSGSLLEAAIIQLDSLDKISRLPNPGQYGANYQERLFNVGLELTITWMNRILFLKLLEAQLLTYHKGDKSYSFLNLSKIKEYDDLQKLFFQVLARRHEDRHEDVKTAFAKVPYLNSSLFEPTDIEHATLMISNLSDGRTIPIISSTVLKTEHGKKWTGELPTLEYLFAFLDAYDFSSEGSDEIQEDSKTLINASVLGLIFEKINGYKDGSFFTPSFITMCMCRETIRKAIVQKFNEVKGWSCASIDDLYDKIDDRREANEIVNRITICDPAVGSGHFLVSALNELIAVKSDLNILMDADGRRLKEYQVDVVNDELIVTDEDGELFDYHPHNKESQRVQVALFHEKQTLIENCLFGVDINPNSVKICRLRLWIELLKNAYYKNETELETLPNIDINIKCGNSLVSRFALDADLKQALKKSRFSIDSYRVAVATYRNAVSKDEKREMERLISTIKSDFRTEINRNDKLFVTLLKLETEYNKLTLPDMFQEPEERYGNKDRSKKAEKRIADLEKEIHTLKETIRSIESNKIFENAFEWRFEFPEVLNEEGDFVGFDVVIGNPPYMRVRDESEQMRKFFIENYTVAENQLDLYHLFIEKAFHISNKRSIHSLIVPNAFLANQNTIKLRTFILDNLSIDKIIEVGGEVFDEASVEVLIYVFGRGSGPLTSKYYVVNNEEFLFQNFFDPKTFDATPNRNFSVTVDISQQSIISKLFEKSVILSTLFDTISGIKEYQVGKGKPPQTSDIVKAKSFNAKHKLDDSYLPELRGRNLFKYSFTWDNEYISYGNWLAEPRIPEFFEGDKILVRQIPAKDSLIASYVHNTFVVDQTAYIAKPKVDLDIIFYLGILNSRLLFWYFQNINNEFDQLFPKIKVRELNSLPIPNIQFRDSNISTAVARILSSKRQKAGVDTSEDEKHVDSLVYQLYGLTAEEIRIVEGGVRLKEKQV